MIYFLLTVIGAVINSKQTRNGTKSVDFPISDDAEKKRVCVGTAVTVASEHIHSAKILGDEKFLYFVMNACAK